MDDTTAISSSTGSTMDANATEIATPAVVTSVAPSGSFTTGFIVYGVVPTLVSDCPLLLVAAMLFWQDDVATAILSMISDWGVLTTVALAAAAAIWLIWWCARYISDRDPSVPSDKPLCFTVFFTYNASGLFKLVMSTFSTPLHFICLIFPSTALFGFLCYHVIWLWQYVGFKLWIIDQQAGKTKRPNSDSENEPPAKKKRGRALCICWTISGIEQCFKTVRYSKILNQECADLLNDGDIDPKKKLSEKQLQACTDGGRSQRPKEAQTAQNKVSNEKRLAKIRAQKLTEAGHYQTMIINLFKLHTYAALTMQSMFRESRFSCARDALKSAFGTCLFHATNLAPHELAAVTTSGSTNDHGVIFGSTSDPNKNIAKGTVRRTLERRDGHCSTRDQSDSEAQLWNYCKVWVTSHSILAALHHCMNHHAWYWERQPIYVYVIKPTHPAYTHFHQHYLHNNQCIDPQHPHYAYARQHIYVGECDPAGNEMVGIACIKLTWNAGQQIYDSEFLYNSAD
jgi:hypothetical protein